MHPELEFQVTRVGCGLAGWADAVVTPLFKEAPAANLTPLGSHSCPVASIGARTVPSCRERRLLTRLLPLTQLTR